MTGRVTIRDNYGNYLAPKLGTSDVDDGHVLGVVGVSTHPHVWTLRSGRITSDGAYWDTYWDPQVGQPIYLYDKTTSSINQQFSVDNLTLSVSKNGDVTQAKKGRKWIVARQKKTKRGSAFSNCACAGQAVEVVPNRYRAIIQRDGWYLEGRIYAQVLSDGSEVPVEKSQLESELFNLAKRYVKSKGLGWRIHRPNSWSTTSAHVTLNRSKYQDAVGKTFDVTLGDIYHFTSEREGSLTRWVVMQALRLDPHYDCTYECHVSIGEQRVKI